MDKFSYRNYDSTIEETVFSSSAGYSDPVNEAETRKQFSYPLYEIKTHLNNTCNIDSADKQVQLKVETANNNILKFSEDGSTWSNVTISADVPVVVEGTVPRGGDEGQVLIKSTNGDYDMEWTDYNNLEAGSGINISNNIIGHSNSVGAQNVQAVYPIKIDSEGHISQYGSAVTSFTPSAHTHGNISNTGDITANATIASGDRLVINDESASKVTNSSITFGTATTTFLSNKGTWLPPISAPKGETTTYTSTSYVQSVEEFTRNSINGVVMVFFRVTFSSTASGTYTRFPIFTGLPKAPSYVMCGTIKIDNTTGTCLSYVGSNGSLYADARETGIAGKIGYGYAVYASAEAMTV